MNKNAKLTSLVDVCSGNKPGELFVIARVHHRHSPLDELESLLVSFDLTAPKIQNRIIFNAKDHILAYYSCFNCIGRNKNNEIFVGETDGYVKYANGKINVISFGVLNPDQGTQQSIYVKNDRNFIFGTYAGCIVYVENERFRSEKISNSADDYKVIRRIHGIDENNLVAVGAHGFVGHYAQDKWKTIPCPSNVHLNAVWCRSRTEIYIGGAEGHIWRWNGDGHWQPIPIRFAGDIADVDICDIAEYQSVLYVACGEKGMFRLEGGQLVAIPKVQNETIGRVCVTTSGLIGLGVGWGPAGSWFTRFDGKSWTAEQVNIKT